MVEMWMTTIPDIEMWMKYPHIGNLDEIHLNR